jgi:hypothetical protein
MSDSKMENLNNAAWSMKALQNIEKLAWPKGAILTCPICLRRSEKTPEQMKKYMNKWPRCCNVLAEVKPL